MGVQKVLEELLYPDTRYLVEQLTTSTGTHLTIQQTQPCAQLSSHAVHACRLCSALDQMAVFTRLHAVGPRLRRLNEAVAGLVDDWNLVSFAPLDYNEEDSIEDLLAQIDRTLQFGEDAEVKIRDTEEADMAEQ